MDGPEIRGLARRVGVSDFLPDQGADKAQLGGRIRRRLELIPLLQRSLTGRHVSKHGDLVDLLMETMDEPEIRGLARRMDVFDFLPGQGANKAQLVDGFVDVLSRRGRVDEVFFRDLAIRAGPSRIVRVGALARAWDIESSLTIPMRELPAARYASWVAGIAVAASLAVGLGRAAGIWCQWTGYLCAPTENTPIASKPPEEDATPTFIVIEEARPPEPSDEIPPIHRVPPKTVFGHQSSKRSGRIPPHAHEEDPFLPQAEGCDKTDAVIGIECTRAEPWDPAACKDRHDKRCGKESP